MNRGLLVVLLCWFVPLVWLHPIQPVPFVDDWVYAWTVENLLTRHHLEVLDYSSNLIYAQALWGAAFCLPFGFSFAALRVSTWVLSCITLVGVHRLLLEAEADPSVATFGTATLAVFPGFLILSYSFMTDVPLLAAETWTFYFFARALRRESIRDLWAGTALAALAGATRFVGLVPAMAMAMALLFHHRWGRARGRFLVPITSVVVVGVLAWHYQHHVRHVADLTYIENTPQNRLVALRDYALGLLPTWLPLSGEFVVVGLGLALAPIAVALRRTVGDRRRMVALLAASAALATVGQLISGHYRPSASEGSWIPDQLGGVLTLMPGWVPSPVPFPQIVIATMACWASFIVIGTSAMRPASRDSGAAPFWWSLAGLVLMTALLWLASDRYIFPFVPPAMALVLGRKAEVSWRRALIPLGLLAVVSVVGLRDGLHAQTALWSAVNDLRRGGVPVAEIDAGYVVNGWLQDAHPNEAHRDGAGNVAVPDVNDAPQLPFVVAVAPLPDTEVVREYRFRRTWRDSGSVFVLKRKPAALDPVSQSGARQD